MGWTYYNATEYKNGKIDRKAELDKQFNWENEKCKQRVLKSQMVGSTYYAAVEQVKNEESIVFAAICLTHTREKDYHNFGYKDMDESCGPYQYECPLSIMKLLSPTDNEYALNWRKEVYAFHKKKKNKETLSTLPVGSIIQYPDYKMNTVTLIKHPAAYQFKTPFWMNEEEHCYVKKNHIPSNFIIIRKGY